MCKEVQGRKLREVEEEVHALKLTNAKMAADLEKLLKASQSQERFGDSRQAAQSNKVGDEVVSMASYTTL